MAESFIDDELAAQLERNEKLVETMLEHGADLDEERPIDFFFFAAEAGDAKKLADDLAAQGFDVTFVADDDLDGKWPVQVARAASVREVIAEPFVATLVRTAARYLAEFDGWGTAV